MEEVSHMKQSSFYPTQNFAFSCSRFPAHVNPFPISNILVHLSHPSASLIEHPFIVCLLHFCNFVLCMTTSPTQPMGNANAVIYNFNLNKSRKRLYRR